MPIFRILAVLVIVSHFGACNCGNSGGAGGDGGGGIPCTTGIDFDGDGFGLGCEAGDDCNDGDATVNVDCCSSGTPFTGCACDPGSDGDVACFDSSPSLNGVGTCIGGTRTCQSSGVWSTCDGQVLPNFEVCDNGGDNDCDGQVDEGVLSACGNCMPGCEDVGVDDDPFPVDDPMNGSDGVDVDENGDLVLNTSNIETFFLWVANDPDGTVSKIDTRTGAEVGRYPAVINDESAAGVPLGSPDPRLVVPIDETTNLPYVTVANGTASGRFDRSLVRWYSTGGATANRSSRTAIDGKQDVWVANRAHSSGNDEPSQTTVTKIYNDQADCIDWNGNGTIETSTDLNDDKVIDPNPANGEFFVKDECIAVTVVVGDVNANARAIAVDAGTIDIDTGLPNPNDPGSAWVGLWEEHAYYRLTVTNPGNGTLGPTVTGLRVDLEANAPGHTPYGAAIDQNGVVWSADACCDGASFIGIDSRANPPALVPDPAGGAGDFIHETNKGGNGFYGMVVDLKGRVWAANINNDHVWRYEPDPAFVGDRWTQVELSNFIDGQTGLPGTDTFRTRGIALDANGNIWAAVDEEGNGWAMMINADDPTTVTPRRYTLGGVNPIGIGVDFEGNVWTVNQGSSNVDRLYVNPATGIPDPAVTHPTTGNLVDTFPVGNNPYTYSDFTGLSRRIVTAPSGYFETPIQACADGGAATWTAINVDVTTPVGTSVRVDAWIGNDMPGMPPFTAFKATATQYGPFSSFPVDLTPFGPPEGAYMVLRISLAGDGSATPIVHGYSVEWTCNSIPIE